MTHWRAALVEWQAAAWVGPCCTTSGCVRATAVDAVQLGIRPIMVREAVGDRDAAGHAQSLFDLDQRYADVRGLEEVLAYLAGQHTAPATPAGPPSPRPQAGFGRRRGRRGRVGHHASTHR